MPEFSPSPTSDDELIIAEEAEVWAVQSNKTTKELHELPEMGPIHLHDGVDLNWNQLTNLAAILGQSQGTPNKLSCSSCEGEFRLFISYMSMQGYFKGVCGNYHYNSLGKHCSLQPDYIPGGPAHTASPTPPLQPPKTGPPVKDSKKMGSKQAASSKPSSVSSRLPKWVRFTEGLGAGNDDDAVGPQVELKLKVVHLQAEVFKLQQEQDEAVQLL
ncbi:hypothetical protein FQN51_005208 [Onygenales sp. PD_10]|nr:hypothetical protein FQN51_005208 [Onygenales sp. PD_10]